MTKNYDVFGVGNAIVDILAQVPDESISDLGLNKASMTLMESDKQAGVLQYLEGKPLALASGGSAANTMVAIAQSGGTGIYAGKVAHDPHGEFYQKDLQEAGIDFYVPLAPEASLPTGTSVILTTPDAERTMCTHLGISATISKSDIDGDRLAQSQCVYVEGYLWSGDDTRSAAVETFELAKQNGIRTAFTFSDLFLVELFRDDFRSLVKDHCDVVFCNADESRKFFEVDSPEECAKRLGEICELGFLTDGGNGCYVTQNGSVEQVAGFKIEALDTVGAGDAFAGGVLYGLTHDKTPVESARWGNYFASRVVGQFGPRLADSAIREQMAEIV